MSRVVTAFSIIAAIIAYSFFAAFAIRNESSELISITEEIKELNKINDAVNADAAAEKLTEQWYDFEKKMSIFVRDDKLNELSRAVSKVRPYITDANDELNAELENIDRQLWLIYRSELPTWYNIF